MPHAAALDAGVGAVEGSLRPGQRTRDRLDLGVDVRIRVMAGVAAAIRLGLEPVQLDP
jgi:hypothetical protein